MPLLLFLSSSSSSYSRGIVSVVHLTTGQMVKALKGTVSFFFFSRVIHFWIKGILSLSPHLSRPPPPPPQKKTLPCATPLFLHLTTAPTDMVMFVLVMLHKAKMQVRRNKQKKRKKHCSVMNVRGHIIFTWLFVELLKGRCQNEHRRRRKRSK